MIAADQMDRLLATMPPTQLAAAIEAFGPAGSTEPRVRVVTDLLRKGGQSWRDEIGQWIADILSVEELVPDASRDWRPLVHRAMAFVASHISDERLAPKIVEQIELPPDTTPETRLGKIISKTPGLQKLGQVLARTRRISPQLREELQKLENGIADVTASDIQQMVLTQLMKCVSAYQVELASELLSEASVSAILEFTWLNPATGRREEGVFKVMKPHVPDCYAEDLWLLQKLAEELVADYRFASHDVAETLDEVRLLLEREVDFRREQATLAEVSRVYRRGGAHSPKPIPELCTDSITAMSVERGTKVTDACRNNPRHRRRIASRIVQSLIADPMFSREEQAVFHADPHAGNLLYNEKTGELVVLDWALICRLSLEERRQVTKLIVMMTFRDKPGVRDAIRALNRCGGGTPQECVIIDRRVDQFFAALPLACSLGAIDAMRLLDDVGTEGVRFPGSLVLVRKVIFTLDGVLADVTDAEVRVDTIVAHEFIARWIAQFGFLPSPLRFSDYIALQRSAVFYASGFWSWVH